MPDLTVAANCCQAAAVKASSGPVRSLVSRMAGGWGWVLGDEGRAAAIVREATRAALTAHDEGLADDGLLAALLEAFGVDVGGAGFGVGVGVGLGGGG